MSVFSEADLAAMRATHEEILTETCTLTPKTITVDGGGWTEADGETTSVSCRYYPNRKPSESVAQDRQRGVREFIVDVPHGTSVNISDEITVDGHTLEVVGSEPRTDELVLRLICTEAVSG